MKQVLFALCLCLSFSTFADNHKYHQAIPGKKIFIDVANQKQVLVHYQTQSKNADLAPAALLKSQWSGFECALIDTQLNSTHYDHQSGRHLRDWVFVFEYSPGADLSGCIYTINFPEHQPATVELFMNY